MRILAGDIGGTKTILSLFEKDSDGYRELRTERYVSASYDNLDPMCLEFLGGDKGTLSRAGFGVAGPVVDGDCQATNLPWSLSGEKLSAALGCKTTLVNDFYAVALGVTALRAADLEVLQTGEVDPNGPITIVGAGTGLGKASMIRVGERLVIMPSEGAHRDFGPRNEEEIGLLRFMLKQHDRVSFDRLISGPGISAIYRYLVDAGHAESPETKQRMESEDPGAVIGAHALGGTDPLCVKTVEMFLAMYGAEAGNTALQMMPTGGVYIAGGIAPRLLPLIKKGGFMEAFTFKGRMSDLARSFRVQVITQTRVGLLGAARAALGDSSTDAIQLAD